LREEAEEKRKLHAERPPEGSKNHSNRHPMPKEINVFLGDDDEEMKERRLGRAAGKPMCNLFACQWL